VVIQQARREGVEVFRAFALAVRITITALWEAAWSRSWSRLCVHADRFRPWTATQRPEPSAMESRALHPGESSHPHTA
jgi:hypothetical protein